MTSTALKLLKKTFKLLWRHRENVWKAREIIYIGAIAFLLWGRDEAPRSDERGSTPPVTVREVKNLPQEVQRESRKVIKPGIVQRVVTANVERDSMHVFNPPVRRQETDSLTPPRQVPSEPIPYAFEEQESFSGVVYSQKQDRRLELVTHNFRTGRMAREFYSLPNPSSDYSFVVTDEGVTLRRSREFGFRFGISVVGGGGLRPDGSPGGFVLVRGPVSLGTSFGRVTPYGRVDLNEKPEAGVSFSLHFWGGI